MTFSPGVSQNLSFDAALGGTAKIGGADVTVGGDVALTSSPGDASVSSTPDQAGSSGLTAHLSMSLTGNQTTFTATCDLLSTNTTLAFKWSAIDGGSLGVDTLCGIFGLTAPQALDSLDHVGFTDVSFDVELTGEQSRYTFVGGSTYKQFRAIAVLDSNQSGWRMAFGVALDGGIKNFPVVGSALGDALSFLKIDAALLLAATEPIPDFDVSVLLGDDATTTWPMPVTLKNAFTIGAVLDVEGSGSNPVAAKLPSIGFTGQMLLGVMLPDPKVQIQLAGAQFAKCEADLTLSIDATPAFELDGSLTIAALGDTKFDAEIGVTPEAISGTLTVTLETPVQLPFCPGIYLDEIGGSVGIDAEAELTGGFLGAFHLKNGTRTATGTQPSGFTPGGTAPDLLDEFALVLGVDAAGVPNLDLFMLQLAEVSLPDLVSAVTGRDTSDPVLAPFEDLTIKDLLVYFCDVAAITTNLPDGTAPTQGFRFHGALDLWGQQAWCAIEVTVPHISGEAYLSPIVIGDGSTTFVSITGDGNTDPGPQARAAGIGTGGALLSIRTSESPYLDASWHVTILDAAEDIVDVTVAKDSFTFTVVNNLPVVGLGSSLACTLTNHAKHFHLEVDGHIADTIPLPQLLGVDLGTADLDADFSMKIDVDVSAKFSLSMQASFTFEGDTLSVSFSPSIPIKSLEDIPKALLQYIKDDAATVFSTALSEAGNLIQTFGGKALEKLLDAESDIVQVFKHIVTLFVGKHGVNAKTQQPPWMQDKALLQGDGDPVYVLRHGVLRHIPGDANLTTYNYLTANYGAPYKIGDIVLSLIPKDKDDIPSLVDGTIIAKDDANQPWYLVVSSSSGPAKYSISDKGTFQTRANIQQYSQLAQDEDIHWLLPENTDLASGLCLISGSGDPKYLFVDGVRIWVHDPDTLLTLRKNLQTSVLLPDATCNAIPLLTQSLLGCKDPGILEITDGMTIAGESSDDIYVVSNHALTKFKPMHGAGHGPAIVPLRLPDDLMKALNYA